MFIRKIAPLVVASVFVVGNAVAQEATPTPEFASSVSKLQRADVEKSVRLAMRSGWTAEKEVSFAVGGQIHARHVPAKRPTAYQRVDAEASSADFDLATRHLR